MGSGSHRRNGGSVTLTRLCLLSSSQCMSMSGADPDRCASYTGCVICSFTAWKWRRCSQLIWTVLMHRFQPYRKQTDNWPVCNDGTTTLLTLAYPAFKGTCEAFETGSLYITACKAFKMEIQNGSSQTKQYLTPKAVFSIVPVDYQL